MISLDERKAREDVGDITSDVLVHQLLERFYFLVECVDQQLPLIVRIRLNLHRHDESLQGTRDGRVPGFHTLKIFHAI